MQQQTSANTICCRFHSGLFSLEYLMAFGLELKFHALGILLFVWCEG